MKRKTILTLLTFLTCFSVLAQSRPDRLERIRTTLDSLAVADPRFAAPVDVSVTSFPVSDFFRSLATGNGLNLNLSLDKVRAVLTCNLEQVPVKDVLLLCCRECKLDLTVSSGIVHVFPYAEAVPPPVVTVERDSSGLYAYEVGGCPLRQLVRSIVTASGTNLIVQKELGDRAVWGFGQGLTLPQLVESVAASNGLRVSMSEDGIWYLYEGKSKDKSLSLYNQDDDGNGGLCARLFPMRFRTVDNILDVIPDRLKKDIEIRVFPDLNSLILSGSTKNVGALEAYLSEIDRSVPMISIDVIIVDATNKRSHATGVRFGKGQEPSGASYGQFSPGVDISLGADRINWLIDAFNGLGVVNLGKVGENFYAGLKLLEEDGAITLHSTPKLSTLNGHKATLTSGEIKYYKESQVNIIGTQNPMQSESYMWKSVEASFTLELLPYVSADSTITIQVVLNQDEFTERDGVDQTSPPGKTKRGFNSIVKVQDGEMVLLGGIERTLMDNSSSGVPFIARIPVLKYLFGNVSKNKESRRLSVFIRPVVIP